MARPSRVALPTDWALSLAEPLPALRDELLLEDPDWPIGWATLELELLEAEAVELLWEVAELLWEVPLPTWELRELEVVAELL